MINFYGEDGNTKLLPWHLSHILLTLDREQQLCGNYLCSVATLS